MIWSETWKSCAEHEFKLNMPHNQDVVLLSFSAIEYLSRKASLDEIETTLPQSIWLYGTWHTLEVNEMQRARGQLWIWIRRHGG